MRLVLKTTALAIPSIFFALLLGRLMAVEIYAAKFPNSPIVKEMPGAHRIVLVSHR